MLDLLRYFTKMYSLGNKKFNLEILTADHPNFDVIYIMEHWLKEDR